MTPDGLPPAQRKKRHGIDPFRYLADLLRRLQTIRPSCYRASGLKPIPKLLERGLRRWNVRFVQAKVVVTGTVVTIFKENVMCTALLSLVLCWSRWVA